MRLKVGDTLGGRYELEKEIGDGGMASVFRAHHLRTGQKRAIKVIKPELSRRDPDLVKRFVEEARIAARIGEHENIVRVDDADIDPKTKIPFIAMELLEGRPLDQLIAEGPIEPANVALLFEQLGSALAQAHEAGVVHRDLKPSNLFCVLTRKKEIRLKVTDFGIAKVLSEAARDLTLSGIGTLGFAAPEQLGRQVAILAAESGVKISAISTKTDIWPLGVIAFSMLTGLDEAAFWGVTQYTDFAFRAAREPAPLASQQAGVRKNLLPPGFDTWCRRCLERDATKRFERVEDATSALVELLQRSNVNATTMQAPSPANTPRTSLQPPIPAAFDPARSGTEIVVPPHVRRAPPKKPLLSPNVLAGVIGGLVIVTVAISALHLTEVPAPPPPAPRVVVEPPAEPPPTPTDTPVVVPPSPPLSPAPTPPRSRPHLNPVPPTPAPAPLPPPAPASGGDFDRGAASASLSSVDVQSCKTTDGPTGAGHVTVTFAPDGSVASAVVDQGPFPGTAVGGCIAAKYRSVHVPAFTGAPVRVGKSFIIQ